MSGRSNITWWLSQNNYPVDDGIVEYLFEVAKSQRRLMMDSEVHSEISKFNDER